MNQPRTKEARLYWRCALQRLADAEVLSELGRDTGAVYLAGYCIECLLKALILENTPVRRQLVMLAEFKGPQAHRLAWLRKRYYETGGSSFAATDRSDFSLVDAWTTDLRYEPASMKPAEAAEFMSAARRLTTNLCWRF